MESYLDEYTDDNLSNFEGDLDVYTGEQDEFVDFAGGSSFINEKNSGRIFQMTLTSDINAAWKVSLIPSYVKNKRGAIVAKTSTIKLAMENGKETKIAGAGSPRTIEDFHDFLNSVPCNLIGFRVTSDNPDQLQQIMSISNHSPFRDLESREIFLGTHQNENSFKDNMVTVPTPNVVLGAETEIAMPILKGTTTITFFVGAVLSTSSALKWKTARAMSDIKTYKQY